MGSVRPNPGLCFTVGVPRRPSSSPASVVGVLTQCGYQVISDERCNQISGTRTGNVTTGLLQCPSPWITGYHMMTKLPRVQNTAARIVTRTARHDHITPVLKKLHWLPVKYSVQYKLLVHTYKSLYGQSPVYMRNMLEVYRPSRTLRSQNTMTLVVPKLKTVMYGNRNFRYSAPCLWNTLPVELCKCENLVTLKNV